MLRSYKLSKKRSLTKSSLVNARERKRERRREDKKRKGKVKTAVPLLNHKTTLGSACLRLKPTAPYVFIYATLYRRLRGITGRYRVSKELQGVTRS